MTFDEWMRSKFWKYLPPDNSAQAQTRLLRQCWDAATAAQAERVAPPVVKDSSTTRRSWLRRNG